MLQGGLLEGWSSHTYHNVKHIFTDSRHDLLILTIAVFMIVVVLLTSSIASVGEGSSHCMTDCKMKQHGPSNR